MKVLPVNKNQNLSANKTVSFQKGLTNGFLIYAQKEPLSSMRKRLFQNGINSVEFQGIKPVLASCLATVEIIKSFGLKIPKNFSYEPLQEDVIGQHTYPDDIVQINSNYKEFNTFLSLDDFETYRKGSPITKHFLQTYIHEFIHAAHFKHLETMHSIDDIVVIAETLKEYEPTEILQKTKVCRPTWKKWEEEWNNSILGDNAKRNLFEFFAENATFEITRILEKNPLGEDDGENLFFNPKKSDKLILTFQKNMKDCLWNRIFNKSLLEKNVILKAIWNGDLDTILDEKYSKYIRKKESI